MHILRQFHIVYVTVLLEKRFNNSHVDVTHTCSTLQLNATWGKHIANAIVHVGRYILLRSNRLHEQKD